MGIAWVLNFPAAENKSFAQTLEDLGRTLTGLGMEKDTVPYTIQCEAYSSLIPMNPPRSFQVITDSDRPASCFLISDKNPADNITAERSFMAFLGKLNNVYASKNASIVEVRGHSYSVKDFIVRAGILTIANIPKGIVVEAELRTCPVLINATELMREFMNMFMPQPLLTHPTGFDTKPKMMKQIYSTMDTVLQYYDLCNNARRNYAVQQK